MSLNTDVKTSYMQVMEATGFYRNGMPTSGVSETSSLITDVRQLEKRIKYNAVINQLNATAIYELSGSPCIYFTQLSEADPEPKKLADLHKLAWNHGLAPMLWVITPTKVLLYNCYSQPTQENKNDPNKHLVELFKTTEAGLRELKDKASRREFESGEFWKWEKAKNIDRKQRVDSILVKDLTDTEAKLVDEQGLERSVGQTLLIQSIFVAYLEDRGILSTEFFQSNFKVDNFVEILTDRSKTNQLFDWIQATFNGNLFPLSEAEKKLIQQQHLNIVKSFISGTEDVQTGQLRLWRIYDFRVIPIELISSIYEKFIYATDSKSAKAQSTHYTPINLVDLVLSEVFRNLDGNAKVLDLACGSGVFLVESLRRLVVKRCIDGETASRKLIRDTLYHQIYGVDINAKAVQIAAFSLYLTALELDYELEQNPQLSDDLKFQKLIGKNLFASDAFDLEAEFNQVEAFAKKEFGAVLGNPPWTKSKFNKSSVEYCKYERPDYPSGYPIARSDNPDQAFLWRIGDFVKHKAQIGLILHGKPFFSPSKQAIKAKNALLTRFKPKVILNLSKLRSDKLFPKATAPAMVMVLESCRSETKDYFYFVCPERSSNFKQHGIVEIGAENIKKLPISIITSNPDIFKIATWGNARDLSIIQYLQKSFPPLKQMLTQDEWRFGRGFYFGNEKKEVPELYGKKRLSSGSMPKFQINIDNLPLLTKNKFERSRDPKIYKSPLVISTRGIKASGFYAAFSQEDVVYEDTYIGISIPSEQINIAHYLNGVLNSSLTSYFLFLTGSSWGIERDEIKSQDLERLPIPNLDKDNQKQINRIIEIERQLRKSDSSSSRVEMKKLDKAVFDLYGLDEIEQVVVEDAVDFILNWFMKGQKSIAVQKPKLNELKLYAQSLISVIKPFLQTLNERTIIADVLDVGNAPLQVVKFSIVSTSDRQEVVQILTAQELETVFKNIAEQLSQEIADRIYTRRNLRIYVGEDIYIVKPAKSIYWTRSAGLNDADIILSEQLKANRDSIR